MKGWQTCLSIFAILEAAVSFPQFVLDATEPSSSLLPSVNITGNLIFQSISSLLQHWPNTKYENGHTIAAASIAPGTLLYHGILPWGLSMEEPEWLATDPEHSCYFLRSNPVQLLTFVATRKLRLVYFDGSSAANGYSGTMDSQDIFVWGKIRSDKVFEEKERVREACKWGKQYGIDGFVRMEMDFEIIVCHFEALKIVSNSTLVPPGPDPLKPADKIIVDIHRRSNHDLVTEFRPAPTLPPGWKGSPRTYSSLAFEVVHAGSWHNHVPGDTRIRIDYSRVISFFDPALTSLVTARANKTKLHYRISGISVEDAHDVGEQLADVFAREGEGSSIDWRSVIQVVLDRYSARLALVRHLLQPSTTRNITEQASQVRTQVLIMLTPYMLISTIPPNGTTPDRSWVSPIVDHCSSTHTAWVPLDLLTRQELVIKRAIEEVLHRICSVLGDVWIDAFDVEAVPIQNIQLLLEKWSRGINALINWLDWSVWDECKPGCGPEEICYIPTWPWNGKWRDPGPLLTSIDMTPRCISRLPPYDFLHL